MSDVAPAVQGTNVKSIAFVDAGARFVRATVRDVADAVASRKVRVRRRSDGALQAEGRSSATTGDFEAKVYAGDVEYDVQFMTEDGEPLNDLFFARVTSSET